MAHGRRDRCVPTRPSTLNPNPKTRPWLSTGDASIPVPISRLGIIPRTRRETGDVRGRTLPVPFVNVHHNATRLHVSPSTTTDEIPHYSAPTPGSHTSPRASSPTSPSSPFQPFVRRDGCPRRRRSVARHPPTRAPRVPCAARSARSPLTPSPLDASAGPPNTLARYHPANRCAAATPRMEKDAQPTQRSTRVVTPTGHSPAQAPRSAAPRSRA